MAGEHAEFLALTHSDYISGQSDLTTRRLPELAMLLDKGNINFGVTGDAQVFVVKYKERALEQRAEMAEVEYARREVSKRATLQYKAGYVMTDAISWEEERKNRGKNALVNMYKSKAKDMVKDAKNSLAEDLYCDGSDAGNERKIDGIETIFQQTGTVGTDEFMVNSGSYLGITMTKGTYGGASAADPEYDFWSPVGVNCVYTGNTWAANADDLLRKAIANTQHSSTDTEDMLDLFALRKSSFLALLELLEDKERFMNDNTTLKRLGFAQSKLVAINYDGVDVCWSEAVPATDGDGKTVHGYGWNFDYVSLEWLGDELFTSGSKWDERQMAYLFWLICGGNVKVKSPRHQCKLAEWPT